MPDPVHFPALGSVLARLRDCSMPTEEQALLLRELESIEQLLSAYSPEGEIFKMSAPPSDCCPCCGKPN